MSHVPRIDESCHTQGLDATHFYLQNRLQNAIMNHVSHTIESCLTYTSVVSHVFTRTRHTHTGLGCDVSPLLQNPPQNAITKKSCPTYE